ncbi:hypothetical protein [Methylomonas fluvii]|nr:hypothetical protein [Methylomonas fluvii]
MRNLSCSAGVVIAKADGTKTPDEQNVRMMARVDRFIVVPSKKNFTLA